MHLPVMGTQNFNYDPIVVSAPSFSSAKWGLRLVIMMLFFGLHLTMLQAQNIGIAKPLDPSGPLPPYIVTTGNGIEYHGGPVMPGPHNVYFIWYGNWNGNTATSI